MTQVPERNTDAYMDYVINLSERGVIRQGVINEPRMYFDEIVVGSNPNVQVVGNPDAFYNGEQWPVRITHLVASLRFLDAADQRVVDNQFNIQAVGLGLRFHDQWYMSPGALQNQPLGPGTVLLPVPLWGNKCVAQGETSSFSTCSWDFVDTAQPFVLSARDTLVVEVQLRDAVAPATAVPVTVSFTGFGARSRRPYLLTGSRNLASLEQLVLNASDYRNDGLEPIIITEMTVTVSAELGANDPRGIIERLRFNVRQQGNGTNAQWFSGPSTPTLPLMQASLAGVSTGRAVVHRFPGDGLSWEPGTGITAAVSPIIPVGDAFSSVLCLGLAGYVMVQ